MEMLDQTANHDYDSHKGKRGRLPRGQGGVRVYLHWRNKARCVSAGFSFVWLS